MTIQQFRLAILRAGYNTRKLPHTETFGVWHGNGGVWLCDVTIAQIARAGRIEELVRVKHDHQA